MDPSVKRIKTHGFENDEDAQRFMAAAHLGPADMGGLLKENWIHILTQDPELSVDDILRMCSLNKRLKALCDTGIIWDEIYKRQFGLEDFAQALVDMRAMGPEDGPESRVALARLFTRRYELMMDHHIYRGDSFADKAGSSLRITGNCDPTVIPPYFINVSTKRDAHVISLMVNCLQRRNIKIDVLSPYLLEPAEGLGQSELKTGHRTAVFCAMLLGFFPRGMPRNNLFRVGDPLCSVCGDAASHQCDRCSLPYCGNECFDLGRPMAPYCGSQCENRDH
jgi:hypothetical protein